MDMPVSVRNGVIIIWATLGISSIVYLIDKWMGVISEGEFMGSLIFTALLCIIPYKICRGSNAARYFYLVLTIISVFIMVGGISIPKLDWVVSIVLLPIEFFAIYCLFQKDSSLWFNKGQSDVISERSISNDIEPFI